MHIRREAHETLVSWLRLADRWSDHLDPLHRSIVDPPTAIQNLADGHDTPARPPVEPAAGSIDQLAPFHRSINASRRPRAAVNDPTATHALGDGHDTPANAACVAPTGPGVLKTLQLDPFQRSASGRWTAPGTELSGTDPTAMHQVAAVHDTADKLPYGNAGTGTEPAVQPEAAAAVATDSDAASTNTQQQRARSALAATGRLTSDTLRSTTTRLPPRRAKPYAQPLVAV